MPRQSVEDVFSMTCDKLRKELKKKRLSVAGKKSDLQFRLVEFLNSQKEIFQETISEEPENEQNVQGDGGEAMDVDNSEIEMEANRTFTVDEKTIEDTSRSAHESTPTNAVSLVLDEDSKREMCSKFGISLQNFEVKSRTRVHHLSSRKSLRASSSTPKRQSPKKEITTEDSSVTPVKQRKPLYSRDRFALIHAKEIEKEETLVQRRDRIQKRHDDLANNASETIKRLATPKSIRKREPISKSTDRSDDRNWKVQDPAQMNFKFGKNNVEDYAVVASSRPRNVKGSSTAVPTTAQKTVSKARARVTVKKLTQIHGPRFTPIKRGITPNVTIECTRPCDDTFTDYISTPKGITPTKAPRRGGYTPHTTKKVFVDTTQLTDREYSLALEEGLIPGKTAPKSNLEKRQLESKKRRDDIIALKRKMNIK